MKKILVFFTILCFIFFFGFAGIFVLMKSSDKQTENTTTEFWATIRNIEVTNTGKKIYIDIYTEEYDTTLYISPSVSEKIDINDLIKGQTIFFRIENVMIEQFQEIDFINIVSLKTIDKVVFSLNHYNEYISDSLLPARIACIIFVLISFFGFINCLFQLRK